MRINAIWASHRTNKTRFQVRAPSIHQHSLSSLVALSDERRCRSWLHCQYFSFGSAEMLLHYLHSHRTDSSNSSMDCLIPSFCTHLSLSEEEVNLIIIPVIVVRNNCWPNKFRFCEKLKTVVLRSRSWSPNALLIGVLWNIKYLSKYMYVMYEKTNKRRTDLNE